MSVIGIEHVENGYVVGHGGQHDHKTLVFTDVDEALAAMKEVLVPTQEETPAEECGGTGCIDAQPEISDELAEGNAPKTAAEQIEESVA
jgi:hypothetical protein